LPSQICSLCRLALKRIRSPLLLGNTTHTQVVAAAELWLRTM
jgi:hypothetical protein